MIAIPDTNDHGEVINSDQTYRAIAQRLNYSHSILIGWQLDDLLDHYDVLFTAPGDQFGPLDEEVTVIKTLFVSIVSIGCFGYRLDGVRKSPEYVADTLGLDRASAPAVTDLINGVIDELR